jgi:hypothetical protein
MADNTKKLGLEFEVIKSSLDQSKRGIAELDKQIQSLKKSGDSVSAATLQSTRVIRELGTVAGKSYRQVEALAGSFVDLTKRQREAEKAARDAAAAIAAAPREAASAQASRGADTAGQVGTGLSSIAALGGSSPIGQAARAGGDIARMAQQAIPALDGMGISIAALGPAALLAIPPVVAVGIAMYEIGKGREAVDVAFRGMHAYFELIVTGTTASLQAGKKEAEIKRLIAQQELDLTRSILADNARNGEVIKSLLGGFFGKRDEQQKALDEATAAVDAYDRALGSSEVAANDAAVAIEKVSVAQVKDITARSQAIQQAQSMQTTEQLDQRIAALDREKKAIQSQLAELAKLDQASEAVTQQTEQLRDRLRQLGVEQKALSDTQLKASVAATESAKKAEQTNKEIAQMQENTARQEVDIRQRTADRVIDITRQQAQAESDAYDKLQQSNAEAGIQFTEQQQDALADYRRGEEKASQDHLKSLVKIRKNAADDEYELILNRDFAGLARSRREADKALAEATEQHNEERTQRLEELGLKLQDMALSANREREQRFRAYRQQLEDLRANAIRQIELTHQAQTLELTRLNQKLTAELSTKQSALDAELLMLADWAAKRTALIAKATGTTGPTTGLHEQGVGGIGGYARGGVLGSGQLGLVNEGGVREAFQSGGKSMMLPNQMGLFMPLQAGRVDPGGGKSITLAPSFTINESGNPAKTVALIRKEMSQMLDAVVAQ